MGPRSCPDCPDCLFILRHNPCQVISSCHVTLLSVFRYSWRCWGAQLDARLVSMILWHQSESCLLWNSTSSPWCWKKRQLKSCGSIEMKDFVNFNFGWAENQAVWVCKPNSVEYNKIIEYKRTRPYEYADSSWVLQNITIPENQIVWVCRQQLSATK